MSAADHSRRSALGIFATAPIAMLPALTVMQCSAPAEAGGISATAAWDAAVAHYRTACAASENYDVHNCTPMFAARDKVFGKAHIYPDDPRHADRIKWEQASGFDAVMKRAGALAEAEGDAEIALLEMPAPHLSALRWKLEHTFEPDGEIAEWRESAVAMIRSDVLRLLPL